MSSRNGVKIGIQLAVSTSGAFGLSSAGVSNIIGTASSSATGPSKVCASCCDSHSDPSDRKIAPYMM